MQDLGSGVAVSGLQIALLFESPEEIYARVFREFKPRAPLPKIAVEFCRFANADSFIRMESGAIQVRVSDLLEAAPAPVVEALAYILLGKLFRRPAARIYTHATASTLTGGTCGVKCTWSARSVAASSFPAHKVAIITWRRCLRR